MPAYRFELTTVGKCIVAQLSGEISTPSYSKFRDHYNEVCRQLLQSDSKTLILDLSQTTFFGSLFVGIVIQLAMMLRRRDGTVALCGLSEQLDQLLSQLMLLEHQSRAEQGTGIRKFATREEALKALECANCD